MDTIYKISYYIPNRIAPDLDGIQQKSTIHFISTKHKIIDTDGNYLYPILYHKDAFWVQFKYICYGNESLEVGVIAKTEEGDVIELAPMTKH